MLASLLHFSTTLLPLPLPPFPSISHFLSFTVFVLEMDNKYRRATQSQGRESHNGVHACHKCGWSFPNPHPSAKHRRAHKKICGTIEGYKLLVSEQQTHCNASDGEQFSDDDDGSNNALDTGNNEKVNQGTGENLIRSCDEVFLDAIANFSDGSLSPRVMESLRDSLDAATDDEIVNIKYPEFSGSCEGIDFNAVDVSRLFVKLRDSGQAQDPKTLQCESVEDVNMLELHGQQSGPAVEPLSGSITNSRTVAHSDDYFELLSYSNPSKAEAKPDVLLENKIYSCENVRDCSLTSVAKEINLKENDEIKSDSDMVEIVISLDNIVGDTCEGMPGITASDVVNSDILVAGGAFDMKEKNNADFLSVVPQVEVPLEMNSILSTNTSTNDVQLESAQMIQFATSGDVKTLQERGEANVYTHPSCDDRPDMAHPQNEYVDIEVCKGVLPHKSLCLPSSEALKPKKDVLKDSVAMENDFLTNQSQLSEIGEIFPPNGRVLLDSSMKEDNDELVADKMHAEKRIEVSSIKFMIESDKRSYETGASMDAVKTEISDSYMIHFPEERGYNDVHKNPQQIPEKVTLKENPSDSSFSDSTTEKIISVINMDKISHHEKYVKEINDLGVDGKGRGAYVENGIGIGMGTHQLSNLHFEVKPSIGVYRSDDAGEMSKFKKCDITDALYMGRPIGKDSSYPKPAGSSFECLILSEGVMDRCARTPKATESVNTDPLLRAQEDIEDCEINCNGRVNEECKRFVSTSADSHHTQDADLLVKASENLGKNYPLPSSLNVEPSAQCISVVEDTQGEYDRVVSGITVVPVQDQSGNNKVQPSPAIYSSVDFGIQCDSLEGHRSSVSESGKSNLKDPEATSEQQCEKLEMFEPPSFMTLVEPGHDVVGSKAVVSEVQEELNQQHPSSTSSPAGWFPITQVTNESEGRKRNEKIIAKITNSRTSKQHKSLQSPPNEAVHRNKPRSPKLEKNSVIQKNGESPAAKAVKGEGENGPNSPAKYPADIKKQNKKANNKPYWIQIVCCSSVNSPRK